MGIVVVGDNIVDVFAEQGKASVGGNCLNVAVNLHQAGIPVRYVGSVGDDELGAAVLSEVRGAGLNTDYIQVNRDKRTGDAFIHLIDGERHFGIFDRGAGAVELSNLEWEVLVGADLIHTSYSSELELEIERLSRIAPVSFDFDEHIDDEYARKLVPYVTHGFFSAADRAENEIDALAADLISSGMRTVTMTRAERGALHFDQYGRWNAEAEPIVASDTLGAGDAFIAGTLKGLVTSASTEDMLRDATAMASAVCTKIGSLGLYVDSTLVNRADMCR